MDKKKLKRLAVDLDPLIHQEFKIKALRESKLMTQKLKELILRYLKCE